MVIEELKKIIKLKCVECGKIGRRYDKYARRLSGWQKKNK
jgi:DNA-directed RNA polymerase subunit N (RpoN/RPB10)